MSEEPGRPDERDRPQPPEPGSTQPVDLGHTRPLPPPSGSFPPPAGPAYPPPPGGPFGPEPVEVAGQHGPGPRTPSSSGSGQSAPQTSGTQAPAAHASAPGQATAGSAGVRGTRSGSLVAAVIGGALAVALLAGVFGGLTGALVASRSAAGGSGPLPVPAPGSTARDKGSIAGIAAEALPGVVTIKVKGADSTGTGSGFVLKPEGYVLTNNHVVAGAAQGGDITVEFSNGTTEPARIIGRDASYDLAVIKVGRTGLPVLPLGASSSVVVGDQVIAVGAPLGLDSTVTSGIVSALNRPVTPGGEAGDQSFINAIQTDAAINPGNSGGPLLDMSGRVIGVNSAIAQVPGSGSGNGSGNIGVGFAIPSDQARKTADQLISTGKASHPVIGVMLDTTYEGNGVRIATAARGGSDPVTRGGPADKAGLKAGDVILKLDGRTILGADQFIVGIRAKSVGDTVELTVRRGGADRTVRMTLQAATD
jgi:putative serine protease PepD